MRDVYKILEEMGLQLPAAPQKGGVYRPAVRFGKNLVYVSGCGPAGAVPVKGILGREFSKEEGVEFSRGAMLNVLAVLEREIGDLNLVRQPVKITTFVAGTDTFYEQPYVANGGSELLAALFGENLVPSRSAIGVSALPGNIPVETEALFELAGE